MSFVVDRPEMASVLGFRSKPPNRGTPTTRQTRNHRFSDDPQFRVCALFMLQSQVTHVGLSPNLAVPIRAAP